MFFANIFRNWVFSSKSTLYFLEKKGLGAVHKRRRQCKGGGVKNWSNLPICFKMFCIAKSLVRQATIWKLINEIYRYNSFDIQNSYFQKPQLIHDWFKLKKIKGMVFCKYFQKLAFFFQIKSGMCIFWKKGVK